MMLKSLMKSEKITSGLEVQHTVYCTMNLKQIAIDIWWICSTLPQGLNHQKIIWE